MRATHLIGPMLGALTVLCWSGYNVAAKHGIDAGLSPQALAFLRFALPGLVALPVLAIRYVLGVRTGIPLLRLAALIFLGGPLFGVVAVSGYVHAPLSHGLLFAPVAVFVVGGVLGAVLLSERLTFRRLVGASVMFLGLAMLVGLDVRGLGPDWGQGVALFVLAGSMWGGYTVLLRFWRIPVIDGTVAVAAGSALVSLPLLGVTASETLRSVSWSDLMLQMVMQGLVGGVVSVVALIGAVRLLSAQSASLLPIFTPVVALGLAAVLFGSVPSGAEIVGVTIIAAGFLLSLGVSIPRSHLTGPVNDTV
ncbi:DMT family transporter [uncultured Tateyamaria sp.]|uniref:DMT family transporter n=1 Tax=Tateyamaria sp. 1078 TaxID=3417464 RepID=UPI002615F573|nr:DMT family transporter [uncultured Tateyamaria sp.]